MTKWGIVLVIALAALLIGAADSGKPSFTLERHIMSINEETGEVVLSEIHKIRVYPDGTRREDSRIVNGKVREASKIIRPNGEIYTWVPERKVMVTSGLSKNQIRASLGTQERTTECESPLGAASAVRKDTFEDQPVQVFQSKSQSSDGLEVKIETWLAPALGCEEMLSRMEYRDFHRKLIAIAENRVVSLDTAPLQDDNLKYPPQGYKQVSPVPVIPRTVP